MKKLFVLISKQKTKILLLLLLISFMFHSCLMPSKADTTQIKEIKLGRKDLIRNDLVKSNNEVFKSLIESQNLQLNSLNKAFFIIQDEYQNCARKLEACKCK